MGLKIFPNSRYLYVLVFMAIGFILLGEMKMGLW